MFIEGHFFKNSCNNAFIKNIFIGIRKSYFTSVFYNMMHKYKHDFISLKLSKKTSNLIKKYINTYKFFILIEPKIIMFMIIKNIKIFTKIF